MHVVEVGQYLVTKDTGSLRQFRSVACREYTLPRDGRASQPKGWIQRNMRIGPVLEVTTNFQHFKYRIELRKQFSFLGQTFLWNGHIRDRFYSRQHRKSWRSARKHSTNKYKCGCSPIKGKGKTTTEGTCWHNNDTIT